MYIKVKAWKLLGLIFTVIFALSAVNVAHAVGVVGTITVGSEPWGVAYDSGKGEIFVVNYGSTTVSVISDSTNTVVANVTVGTNPMGAAYDFWYGEVFVTNWGSNTVSVISDSSNTVVATVPVGTHPGPVAFDMSGEIFVANIGSNTVSVISDSSNTVVATVPVGTSPGGVAYYYNVYTGKGEIFVANSYSNTVSVISDSNNTVVATVPVGTSPGGVAYDSVKSEIFVANYGSNTVSVISVSNNTVVATVNVGTGPGAVAYDLYKGEIFVANIGSNTVSVISDSNNHVVATVPVGTHPYGAAYDFGKGEIFVANLGSNTVSVISDSPNLVAPSVSSSPGAVDQGQTSNLTSSALTTGAAPYKYQWFSKAPGVSSYSLIGGANSSSYSFVTSTSMATGNWSFILQVTDATHTAVNSTAATVTVNSAPTVSITPASWTMDVGQSHLFTSSVSGGTSPYSYQWYLNGVAQGTNSSWTFTPSSAGSYSVYVNATDSTGVRSKSNVAAVTVNAALSVAVSPASVTMDVGQSKTFTSTVSGGASPYSYQWYLNGSAVGGATGSSYTFTPSSRGHYNVYLNVTDSANAKARSNTATATVNSALSVTTSPPSVTIGVGHSETFNASVSGGASPYSYQWYLNGSLVSGATSSSWTFKPTSTGVYIIYVKTTDALNATAQSSIAQLKVKTGGPGLIGIALIGVVVAAVVCVGAVFYTMRKRPEKPSTPTKLKIQTEPTEIIADGKSKSTITVQLLDKKGQPIAAMADTEVKLTTTGGKIESPVIKIPKGKDTGTTTLTSSMQSGEVTLLAAATKLKRKRAHIIFSERARFCMGCGNRMAVKEATCKKCGTSPTQFAGPETKKCEACDTTIPSAAKFCSECGAKQSPK
jgi:YVTN family beta-propeller protein